MLPCLCGKLRIPQGINILPLAKVILPQRHRSKEREIANVFFCASVANKNSCTELIKDHHSSTFWLMSFLGIIKAESYKRGMVLSVLFNIISKGILFLLTIIIARYFGSNIKTDIYFFVFGSMVLFSGFVNNIDTAVLIPESMRLREKADDKQAAAFLNSFLLIYFIVGILFTVFMYFFGIAAFSLVSKFSQADIYVYRNYFWLGSLFFIFMVLTNAINAILTSLKFFSVPMIISAVNSCIVIAAIFLLKADYDVLSIFIGGLIAYTVNLVIQLLVLKKMTGWHFVLSFSFIKKKVCHNIFYAELGQLATVATSMFPLYLLSGFGSGVISVMNYGKNIADIPNTLVTSQFASVSGIKLNEQIARQDYAGMNDTFLRTSKFLVFLLVPAGFFLFVCSRPIIDIFYLHGGFNVTSAAGAAVFMQLLAVTVFSIGINAMVARIFIAMQAMRPAFIYQVIMNLVLFSLIWGFVKYYGQYGYCYAVITLNIINLIGMFFMCRIIAPYLQYIALIRYLFLIIILNGIIAAAVYYVAGMIHAGSVFKIAVLFTAWVIILAILNKLLHLDFNIEIWFKKQLNGKPV
jgi:peptidoglycan biosynthesis protein MviN/MurJ (putative lipid II flippase)